jgi:hypothetical protein
MYFHLSSAELIVVLRMVRNLNRQINFSFFPASKREVREVFQFHPITIV